MSNRFDLIIIGAGPAGSTAAFTAAKEGISVLLLEEHPKIGVPLACAEALSRSTIKGYLEVKPEWIVQDLFGGIVRGPDGHEFSIEYPNVGWVLNRKVFDPALAKIAEAHGAVVKTSAKAIGVVDNEIVVNESRTTKRYKFKFLIGADGIASKVGTWMGINTRLNLSEIEVCAQYLIEDINIPPHYVYFILSEKYAPGGYAWIFPKSHNSANVGLGISPLRTKKSAKFFLDQWVKKEFKQGKIREKIYGGTPIKVLERFSGENFYLIGDAARFTDPLNGGGIANAIKSGVIAGKNAVLRLRGKKDFFVAEIKKNILKEIKFHLKVRGVYLKLTEEDLGKICKTGKKIFGNKNIDNFDIRYLIREILLASPQLLRIGFKVLF